MSNDETLESLQRFREFSRAIYDASDFLQESPSTIREWLERGEAPPTLRPDIVEALFREYRSLSAEAEARRESIAHNRRGRWVFLCHASEDKSEVRLLASLDAAHALLGKVYLAQSQPEEALREMEQIADFPGRLFGRALAHHALGHREEADTALSELIEKYGDGETFDVAEIYAYRGEIDRAFEWLERAYTRRDRDLLWIKGDPLLASLEDDPRYAALLDKMGLAD